MHKIVELFGIKMLNFSHKGFHEFLIDFYSFKRGQMIKQKQSKVHEIGA